MTKAANLFEQKKSLNSFDDKDISFFIKRVREGIKFTFFTNIANKSPFSLHEWSNFLHISVRTMQRYKNEKHTFDILQSEKILQITILYRMGIDVFGTKEKFNTWLETENLILGKTKPKTLLDNAFGIDLLKDELIRIEHGVLA